MHCLKHDEVIVVGIIVLRNEYRLESSNEGFCSPTQQTAKSKGRIGMSLIL